MPRIDVELVFDRYLGNEVDLGRLEAALHGVAPTWASGLHVAGDLDEAVPAAEIGSLGPALLAAATARGPTYHALVARHGPGPFERTRGTAELGGAMKGLALVVMIDEWMLAPIGGSHIPGNLLFLHLDAERIEGMPAQEWISESFNALCAQLEPIWARAGTPEEYRAKTRREGTSISARQFSSHLPGLFWQNFFASKYCDVIGRERLTSAPTDTAPVGSGIVLRLHEDPRVWERTEYQERERAVKAHVGHGWFFDPDKGGGTEDSAPIAGIWPEGP